MREDVLIKPLQYTTSAHVPKRLFHRALKLYFSKTHGSLTEPSSNQSRMAISDLLPSKRLVGRDMLRGVI